MQDGFEISLIKVLLALCSHSPDCSDMAEYNDSSLSRCLVQYHNDLSVVSTSGIQSEAPECHIIARTQSQAAFYFGDAYHEFVGIDKQILLSVAIRSPNRFFRYLGFY